MAFESLSGMDNSIIFPFNSVLNYLPQNIAVMLKTAPFAVKKTASEIRLRAGRAITISCGLINHILNTENLTYENIFKTVETICNGSIYSYEEDIKNGFITLPGGHRAGICGSAVLADKKIQAISDISSINLRISREIIGAADDIMPYFNERKTGGMLILSPPGYGKTTVIRDMARQLSDIKRLRVAIIDERSEIAAVKKGIPQNNVGIFTDVLDGYRKPEGIMLAIRSLAPQVIICDEIGGDEDAFAVLNAAFCGVFVIATAHASGVNDIKSRQYLHNMLTSGVFHTVISLSDKHSVENIWQMTHD